MLKEYQRTGVPPSYLLPEEPLKWPGEREWTQGGEGSHKSQWYLLLPWRKVLGQYRWELPRGKKRKDSLEVVGVANREICYQNWQSLHILFLIYLFLFVDLNSAIQRCFPDLLRLVSTCSHHSLHLLCSQHPHFHPDHSESCPETHLIQNVIIWEHLLLTRAWIFPWKYIQWRHRCAFIHRKATDSM